MIIHYIWTFLALYVKRAKDLNDLHAYLVFPLLILLLGFAEFATIGENLGKWIHTGIILVWCVVGLFFIYMLVKLFAWKGTNGSNKYGPDPLEEKRGILGQSGRMSRGYFSLWTILS